MKPISRHYDRYLTTYPVIISIIKFNAVSNLKKKIFHMGKTQIYHYTFLVTKVNNGSKIKVAPCDPRISKKYDPHLLMQDFYSNYKG